MSVWSFVFRFYSRMSIIATAAGADFTRCKINHLWKTKRPTTLIHSSEPRYGEGHIFLWWENYCRRLLYADILYVEGSGSYSEFHAIDGSRVTISYRLGVMERSLPDDTFIRVHQSFILNGIISIHL